MKRIRRLKIFFAILNAAILGFLIATGLGCGPDKGESPTSGHLVIISAESVSPAVIEITKRFNELYKNATVEPKISTSREAIVRLLNSEVKLVVVERKLNREELDIIKKYDLYVDTIKVAYDGLAVVVHPSNPLSQLSLSQLEQIATGKVKRWRDLSPKGRTSPDIFLALGGPNTSAYEMLKTDVAKGAALSERVYPCSTSTQVLDLIRNRPEAIGFVGTGWLANDSSKVKVLDICGDEYFTDASGRLVKCFSPHPAHIYRGFYALRRPIYLLSREKGFGLGAGFTSFVASAAGQKLFLEKGYVPATMPVRLTQATSE
jgi:phosphate transport system substrate-binding protein